MSWEWPMFLWVHFCGLSKFIILRDHQQFDKKISFPSFGEQASEISEDFQTFLRNIFVCWKLIIHTNLLSTLRKFWRWDEQCCKGSMMIFRNLCELTCFLLNIAHPQNFLGILRFFWGLTCFLVEKWSSSGSEFSEDWLTCLCVERWSSSEFSEGPEQILKIDLLFFERWSSSEFSEDWHVFCWKIVILRIFWGSSENSED